MSKTFKKVTQIKFDVLYNDYHEIEAMWRAIVALNANSEYNIEIPEQQLNTEDVTIHYIKPHIEEEIDLVLITTEPSVASMPVMFIVDGYRAMKGFGRWERISECDKEVLKNGEPIIEYFESWERVKCEARFINNEDGRIFKLKQVGRDLYLSAKEIDYFDELEIIFLKELSTEEE